MILSKLLSTAKTWEKIVDFWGNWLFVFTTLVVIGLLLEYLHEVPSIIPPSIKRKYPDLERAIGLLGALLVVVGVAGELIAQYRASLAEDLFRSAGYAIEGQLIGSIANADRKAVGARTRAAIAERETAKAKTAQARVELQLEKIREGSESRNIHPPKDKLFDSFLKDAPKGSAEVLYAPEDVEAEFFAFEISSELLFMGWRMERGARPLRPEHILREFSQSPKGSRNAEVEDSMALITRAGGAIGVTLLSNKAPEFGKPSPAESLMDAFSSIGPCGWRREKELPDDHVRIIIGPKQ